MDFTIPKDILRSGLERIRGAVSTKDVRPVLKNVRVQAIEDQGVVILQSTNLELSQEVIVRVCDIRRGGDVMVPAMKLFEMVDLAGGKDVRLLLKEMTATVSSGRANWRLICMPPEEFPTLPVFPSDNGKIEVAREALLQGLQRVSYAISDDETRENLMMVCIDNGKMMASGGHRASSCPFDDLGGRIQIPAPSLTHLVRLLNSSGVKAVMVAQDESHLMFDIGGDTFSTRQLEVEFPDIDSRLFRVTERFNRELIVDKGELRDMVKRMRILADQGTNAIILEAENDSLTVATFDNTGNESSEDLPCKCPHQVSFGVNADYIEDLLKVVEGKAVSFRFGENVGRSPCRVQEEGFTSVLLPMRIAREQNAEEV